MSLRPSRPKILEDWGQEGSEDPEADECLLRDSLTTLREHRAHPELWQSWNDFEAELDRGEAAGELPA